MKKLILYYSFEGNTEFIAKVLAEALNAPIIRIHPTKDLTSTGFSKYVWGGGQVVMGIKPKLEPIEIDLNDFDVIFLGTPIWAGTYAPPIKTLLEDGVIKNKRVFYFYTHEGGAQNAVKRAETGISKYNQFIAAAGFLDVLKNTDENSRKAQLWARDCIEKIDY
jgi:flavodoxin